MSKTFLSTAFFLIVFFAFTACSDGATNETQGSEINTEITNDPNKSQKETEKEKPGTDLGNLKGLVGSWTVDAATAGVKMDLTFGKDGSFKHLMGNLNGEGTWEVIDEDHINIVTQNTKGQKWKITDLKENTVGLCWNPDNPNPKTIPMQRVQ